MPPFKLPIATRPRGFTVYPRGPFSLHEAREFNCDCMVETRNTACALNEVRLAFPLDREANFTIAGVTLRAEADALEGQLHTSSPSKVVAEQVVRFLSLAHDGAAFDRVLARDDVLAALAAERPRGFRPLLFPSPYTKAAWSILASGISMRQAARTQARIARAFGDWVCIDGQAIPSFPRPQTFLATDGFEGVSAEKWRRLQGIARAALAGYLDAARLSSMPYDFAVSDLAKIRGIGPVSAAGIMMRAVDCPDAFIRGENRVTTAILSVYDKRDGTAEDAYRIAERWRPFRSWASVLVMMKWMQRRKRQAAGTALRKVHLAEIVPHSSLRLRRSNESV